MDIFEFRRWLQQVNQELAEAVRCHPEEMRKMSTGPMERLRTPLMVNAVYIFLIGLVTLSSSAVHSVFGYTVMDRGVLLVLSGSLLGLGVILWGIASDPEKHGGLWTFVVTGIAISTVWLLLGWGRHLFTARNVLVPVIINVVLLVWIWSARPKT